MHARQAPRAQPAPILQRVFNTVELVEQLETIRNRHGDVVWTTVFHGIEVLALLSADGLERALLNKDGAYSSRLGWRHYVDHVFPGAIIAMDEKEHRYHRRILQEAFTRPSLEGYVEQMNPVIARRIDGLVSQREGKGIPSSSPPLSTSRPRSSWGSSRAATPIT
jgi:cytochrome P450